MNNSENRKDLIIPAQEQKDLFYTPNIFTNTSSWTYTQDYYLDSILNEIRNEKISLISTGIASLDQLLKGGFQKATLTALTGGAGSGKTALALQINDSIAQQGKPVLYISMEINRSKLTKRSLARVYYLEHIKKGLMVEKQERLDAAAARYRAFCKNIRIVEGHEGMTLAQLKDHIARALDETGQEMLVTIDPFQRLSTGNHNLDAFNETLKTNKLCSTIKQIANEYTIPILMLCDTTKSHKSNQSGEGSARGSYMIDHIVDCNMMIRTDKSDPLKALFGEIAEDENYAEATIPFFNEIKNAANLIDTNKQYWTNGWCEWDKWAAIVTSKQRDGLLFNPLFVYKPAYHCFFDTKITAGIIKQENIFEL